MDILHNLQWVLPLRSAAATQLAFGLSWLGYSTFIMFFLVLGYWTWSKSIFYRLLVLVAINALLNAFVKDLVQDPRPLLALRLDDLVGQSYGLPSGHAQLAVVMWLWLAWELRRRWAWVLASCIAVAVMFSRLYLGVHDLEDVLAGAVLGGGSLLVFERLRHQPWVWQCPLGWHMAWITAITALALALWPNGAPPTYIGLVAAWLLAATWARAWEPVHIGYMPPRALPRKIVLGLLGTAGFVLEQKLLQVVGTLLPLVQLSALPALLWPAVQGLCNGLFVALLMPWLFVRLRLAGAVPGASAPHPSKRPRAVAA